MQELPFRYSAAPYQYGPHLPPSPRRSHPAEPLAWLMVLIFVPFFWLSVITWFARSLF